MAIYVPTCVLLAQNMTYLEEKNGDKPYEVYCTVWECVWLCSTGKIFIVENVGRFSYDSINKRRFCKLTQNWCPDNGVNCWKNIRQT